MPLVPVVAMCLVTALISCEVINPEEPVPAYVRCDTFSFRITSANQGSASSSISDVWAFLDGNLLGAFEMPARFPVIAEGTHTLTIQPGILVNGIKSMRGPYPYYESYDTIVEFKPNAEVVITPRTTYNLQATFSMIEDFEQSGLYFERGAASDTTLNIINDANAFEGHSGSVYLDVARDYFNYRSSPPFISLSGTPVYAELNYKCDNEFNVGVVSHVGASEFSEEILTIRPSATWKKIYVDLSGAIAVQPTASGYRLLLTATKASGIPSTSIYFDNIKVVQ